MTRTVWTSPTLTLAERFDQIEEAGVGATVEPDLELDTGPSEPHRGHSSMGPGSKATGFSQKMCFPASAAW